MQITFFDQIRFQKLWIAYNNNRIVGKAIRICSLFEGMQFGRPLISL